ncbi:MAG: TRAP transporter substrate-binding protein DctP [Thermodesulfobacteriota bacterium]
MRMQSRLYSIAAATLALVFLLPFAAFAAAPRTVWKVATLAPKDLGWAQQVKDLVFPWVEKSTDDTIALKVYWGGVMGNDEEYIKKIEIGQLQGAGVSGAGCNMACPEFTVLGLPFLFNNYDEVDYLRKTMFDELDRYFQTNGFKLILWVDQDFDQTYSTKHPMVTLEDFRNSRFQNWYGPMEAAVLRSLGASPVPVTVMEGHSALKTGVVDAAFGPALYYVGSQLYTVWKYVNTMKIRYSPGAVILSLEAWNAVPEDYQKKLQAGRQKVCDQFVAGTRLDNERCLKGIIKYGVILDNPTPENLAEMKKKTHTVYKELAGSLYPAELLAQVEQSLTRYRAGDRDAAPVAGIQPKPIATPAKPPEPPAPAPSAPAPKPVPAAPVAQPPAAQPAAPAVAAPAPAPAAPAAPAVAKKSKRELLREVQTKLQALGYYSYEVDGLYGPVTRRAITAYQKDNNLRPTGTVNPDLLVALQIKE